MTLVDPLLGSLIAEELRGRPQAAATLAYARAERDPGTRPGHLLDAACALLVAGEARAALAALDEITAPSGTDLERRCAAARNWSQRLDKCWYPGNRGTDGEDTVELIEATPGEPATMLLEACVAYGPPYLLVARAAIDSFARLRAPVLGSTLQEAGRTLDRLVAAAQATGALTIVVWAMTAVADLARCAGLAGAAEQLLTSARARAGQLCDRLGAARCDLVEGDWYATPSSSPEALGFDLAQQSAQSVVAHTRDLARARSCYERAGERLAGLDAPRAHAALALRRSALHWLAGRFAEQSSELDVALTGYADAGDTAGASVVRVHQLLCELGAGKVARVRRSAGTGIDLRPRGQIAALASWGRERGSASFVAGLGRLLQRAGDVWAAAADDLDRAEAAYSMAVPLLALGNPALAPEVLDALGGLDVKRHFLAHALVRFEQTIRTLPDVHQTGTAWLAQVNLVSSVLQTENRRVTQSPSAFDVSVIDRAIARMRALCAVDGVPTTDALASVLRDSPAALRDLARGATDDGTPRLASGETAERMVAIMAQLAREQISTSEQLAMIARARIAQQAGSTVTAERWFETVLERIDTGSPADGWTGVIACVAAGRKDEARERFERVKAGGALPEPLLAGLALRVGAYEEADALLATSGTGSGSGSGSAGATPERRDTLPWDELAMLAELALERADGESARTFGTLAWQRFEAVLATLDRDPDRVAMCDDIRAASLQMVLARALIALAEQLPQTAGPEAARLRERAFEVGDRGHALALASLLTPSGVGHIDVSLAQRWRQAAADWSAAYERLLVAYVTHPDERQLPQASELTRAEDALVDVEALVEARAPGTLAAARRLPPQRGVDAIRDALPAAACLLQYSVVGRDLLVWGLAADRADASFQRLARPGIEPLVRRYWDACASGPASADGSELAQLLLAPVAELLRASERVVIVPFGALSTVPFQALPFDGQPLGAGRTVSYLPAASMLAGRALDEPVSAARVLAVGDPAFDAGAYPELPRLPGAAVEAQAIGRVWRERLARDGRSGGSGSSAATRDRLPVLVGDACTAQMLRRLLPGCAVAHIAAHGRLDQLAPNSSALIFAGSDTLTVAELIGLRVEADLVVLSACDSGRGAATLGGDVIGLARGLLAAGVRRAIVSLWPVDDRAACVTMVAMHERLAAGAATAAALAEAQAVIRRMTASEIAGRYAELGGVASTDARSTRRGTGPPVAAGHPLALDPEFVDSGDELTSTEPDGWQERVWAPFILIG